MSAMSGQTSIPPMKKQCRTCAAREAAQRKERDDALKKRRKRHYTTQSRRKVGLTWGLEGIADRSEIRKSSQLLLREDLREDMLPQRAVPALQNLMHE